MDVGEGGNFFSLELSSRIKAKLERHGNAVCKPKAELAKWRGIGVARIGSVGSLYKISSDCLEAK